MARKDNLSGFPEVYLERLASHCGGDFLCDIIKYDSSKGLHVLGELVHGFFSQKAVVVVRVIFPKAEMIFQNEPVPAVCVNANPVQTYSIMIVSGGRYGNIQDDITPVLFTPGLYLLIIKQEIARQGAGVSPVVVYGPVVIGGLVEIRVGALCQFGLAGSLGGVGARDGIRFSIVPAEKGDGRTCQKDYEQKPFHAYTNSKYRAGVTDSP